MWSTGASTAGITVSSPGTYTVTVTAANGCTDTASIEITQDLTAPMAPISGGNQIACGAGVLTATADVSPGESITWYDAPTEGNIVLPDDVILDEVGTVTYYAETISNTTGCISSDRTAVTLTIENIEVLLLNMEGTYNDVNGNDFADVGDTVTYTFTIENTGNMPVTDIDLISDDLGVEFAGGPLVNLQSGGIDDNTFTAVYFITEQDTSAESIEVTVEVIGNVNDCVAQSSASSVVSLPVLGGVTTFEVFNGLTPNGDGKNDTFLIRGIDAFPDNRMQIFNRWGTLVWETRGYDQQTNMFTGTANVGSVQGNGELPTGTYFYVLEIDNPNQEDVLPVYRGYLYLNR